MSKGKDAKKNVKKEPVLSAKEKKAAKRLKKNSWFLPVLEEAGLRPENDLLRLKARVSE